MMRVLNVVTLISLGVCASSCTDAKLYHSADPPLNADRVTIEGRVCTEDPEVERFPVRLILLVDQGQGPLYSCLLYTSPSPRDGLLSRMPSSA